jgi:DNA-binding response OmpR family regulator
MLPKHHPARGTVDTLSPELPIDAPTILVVEDYEGSLRLIAPILAQAGYRVLSARRAPLGLEYLREGRRVDLVISDVIMAAMSGCKLALSIFRHRSKTPVLFLTGLTADSLEIHLQCGSRCTVEVLQKPFGQQALLDKIRCLLNHRTSRPGVGYCAGANASDGPIGAAANSTICAATRTAGRLLRVGGRRQGGH